MFEKPDNSQEISIANDGAKQHGVGSVDRAPDVPPPKLAVVPLKSQDPPKRSSPGKRAAILVLGVHRSGTSSLANLLNVLGATLPEQVLGPGYGNPLGHWEPIRLMEINDQIHAAIGRSWNDSRSIPRGWFRSREAYAFHERIAAEITSGYGDAQLILIKEPRICRLAPLYLDVLDALGIEPLILLPVRHPGEVIRSLQERDQMDPHTAELLWLRSLLEAEEASRSCVRVWTSFEGLLEDWESTMDMITRGLGVIWPNEPSKVSAEAAEVVRPRHRHYRITDDPSPLALTSLTIRAWEAARRGVNGDEDAARAVFDEIRTVIWEIDRLKIPHEESIEKRFAETNVLARSCDRLNQQLQQQLQARDAQIEQLQQQLQARHGQTEQLQQQFQARDAQIEQLQQQFQARDAQIEQLQQQLQARHGQIEQLQLELGRLQSTLGEQENDAIGLRRRIDSLQGSACWRLTWPIRWLHEKARGAKSVITEVQLD